MIKLFLVLIFLTSNLLAEEYDWVGGKIFVKANKNREERGFRLNCLVRNSENNCEEVNVYHYSISKYSGKPYYRQTQVVFSKDQVDDLNSELRRGIRKENDVLIGEFTTVALVLGVMESPLIFFLVPVTIPVDIALLPFKGVKFLYGLWHPVARKKVHKFLLSGFDTDLKNRKISMNVYYGLDSILK